MYHTYSQIVYTISSQETGIAVFDRMHLMPQNSMDYTNNSINMGAMIGSQSKYNQETNTRNQGRHNQKTINHTPTGLDVISEIKNYSNTDGLYNRGTHRFYRNPMNDFNKQQCNTKDKKHNCQNTYSNKQNNKQNVKMEKQSHKQNFANRIENYNQNNNYQHHNRNHYGAGFKRNWSWQYRQRNQKKNIQNIDSISSSSSSTSSRQCSASPGLAENKTPNKKGFEVCNLQSGIQVTPRKSPTLGEYIPKPLIDKEYGKGYPKNLSLKKSSFGSESFINSNGNIMTQNACFIAQSWPDQYNYENHQFYYQKGYRANHNYHQNAYSFNGYGHSNRKNYNNKQFSNGAKEFRQGICYQKTRGYHLELQKELDSNLHYSKAIGCSVPYSLHNLQDLYSYYKLAPRESLPYYSKNFYVPADRFIMKLSTESVDNGELNKDKLSQAIWDKYLSARQTEDTYRSKLMLWKYLFLFIKNFHTRYSLFLVGSTMTGFASNGSDVDFCLVVKNIEIDQRNEAHMHLDNLYRLILSCADDYFKDVRLFPAKVPILRFHDVVQNLDVDLNCNNFVGIRNTHLLHCYNQMNWRLRPLVIFVKQWARVNQINSARESTISSYSLTLMVIHYLQCGVKPPVLPCLHSLFPGKFNAHVDIHTIEIHEKLEPYKTDNKQSLGELLLGFFDYYANFDYSKWAISIRLATLLKIDDCKIEQMPKNDPMQWLYMCIEEPFDRTNTARSVYQYNMFLYIKSVFHYSYQNLKQYHDIDKIMDLGLSVPEIQSQSQSQSSSEPIKTLPLVKLETKNIYRNECALNNENPEKLVEITGILRHTKV